MTRSILAVGVLIFLGALGRLVPHAPNATPLTALSAFGARHLGSRAAFVIPLAALFISDLVIGLYDWRLMAGVYGSFVLIAIIARLAARTSTPVRLVLVPLVASTLFFIITNATVWAFSPWYEKTFDGLMYAYTLGLPFFRNMLIGDLVYVTVALLVVECVRVCTLRYWSPRAQSASA